MPFDQDLREGEPGFDGVAENRGDIGRDLLEERRVFEGKILLGGLGFFSNLIKYQFFFEFTN